MNSLTQKKNTWAAISSNLTNCFILIMGDDRGENLKPRSQFYCGKKRLPAPVLEGFYISKVKSGFLKMDFYPLSRKPQSIFSWHFQIFKALIRCPVDFGTIYFSLGLQFNRNKEKKIRYLQVHVYMFEIYFLLTERSR